MAYVGEEENIEMDNMNDNDQNDLDNDDENSALIKDQIQSTSTHKKLMPPLEKPGAQPKTLSLPLHSYENPSYVLDDDIPEVDNRPTTLTGREDNRDSAWDRIKRKFPYFKPKKSNFTARVDEFGRVKVKLARRGSKEHYFFDNDNDDELNSDLPTTLKKNLGPSAEKIIEKIDRNNERWADKNREDVEQLAGQDISEEERKMITDRVNMRNERIDDGVQEIERIQERMKLTDRIKSYFKRYGFTAIAVISAVGAVIGVIVSNLKTGLTKLTNGLGNGLKDIGKKLGAILPGMIGAIASFIFKTAGEVVGFLAKNAWLLIIAVVIFFVDQFKSRFKKKNK